MQAPDTCCTRASMLVSHDFDCTRTLLKVIVKKEKEGKASPAPKSRSKQPVTSRVDLQAPDAAPPAQVRHCPIFHKRNALPAGAEACILSFMDRALPLAASDGFLLFLNLSRNNLLPKLLGACRITVLYPVLVDWRCMGREQAQSKPCLSEDAWSMWAIPSQRAARLPYPDPLPVYEPFVLEFNSFCG